MPLWEDNRSAGTMAPSWRDPDLFPWGNIGWTRRGVPFWKDNRSDGTMERSGPISKGGLSTYWELKVKELGGV